MGFSEAVQAVLAKYMVIEGRARRSEYWWFTLAMILGNIATGVVDGILGISLLSILFGLAVLIPSLTVSIRRLHDVGKSGWWLLIVLVPIVGWLVLLFFTVQDSQQGANAYGENPKQA
ncbi:Uncharacterized membrane protein YhaH, DUF805 family [Monaibacterium marinum]|uniref:Uncharacterized membrane protein YhaH, DUF805 family n=1 Tax=Pontivivens marinum TaxID=1690039 RepID=A0A2C9CRQ2_9RHOB|nr:DUF805 domain-containing protein [Monaibacterium marinum]SOH93059.1 Uncharacterized membrane protein YhaH, DUF805 family [Monaibacterium marinum]